MYAGTLGIPAFGESSYSGDEAHFLLAAKSVISDGDVDVTDQHAEREYAGFYPYDLRPSGRLTSGRLNEPSGIGFPLLIAPAYAVAGAIGVEILMAAIAALAFVLAAVLARRLVPEPWATGGVVLVALSPPVLAYSASVYPELAAGALAAGAVLCALELRDSLRLRFAYGGALALAPLPWLDAEFTLLALPVAVMLVRWTSRTHRRVATLGVAEIMIASLAAYVTVNEILFGGFTPSAAALPEPGGNAASEGEVGEWFSRLPALWLDRDQGLLRWAPILALGGFAAWLLWRSRREHLARLIPARRDAEVAAGLLLAACAGPLVIAAVAAPWAAGSWFPGRHAVAALPCAAALTAWGLRHAPRVGAALGALTVLAGVWVLAALRVGTSSGWNASDSAAPWGPAEALLPAYGVGSAWADAVTAGALVASGLLVAKEWRAWRAPPELAGRL